MILPPVQFRPYEPLVGAEEIAIGPALVVAPHPDDEILGCGGTLHLHRERGFAVTVLIMTDGAAGDPTKESGEALIEARRRETEEAVARIGGARVLFWGHPDGRLREAEGLASALAALWDEVKPATVFFPSPWEIHPDHVQASYATLQAAAMVGGSARCLGYEVGAAIPANVLVDITAVMPVKERAVQAFASQLLHHDLVGKMRSLARARTVNVDNPRVRYAEAFLHLPVSAAADYLQALQSLLGLNDQRCRFLT